MYTQTVYNYTESVWTSNNNIVSHLRKTNREIQFVLNSIILLLNLKISRFHLCSSLSLAC